MFPLILIMIFSTLFIFLILYKKMIIHTCAIVSYIAITIITISLVLEKWHLAFYYVLFLTLITFTFPANLMDHTIFIHIGETTNLTTYLLHISEPFMVWTYVLLSIFIFFIFKISLRLFIYICSILIIVFIYIKLGIDFQSGCIMNLFYRVIIESSMPIEAKEIIFNNLLLQYANYSHILVDLQFNDVFPFIENINDPKLVKYILENIIKNFIESSPENFTGIYLINIVTVLLLFFL